MRLVNKVLVKRWFAGGGCRWALVAVVFIGLALPATAEFYRYTDADGQVHYVDDPRHIPDSQLDTLRIYQEDQSARAQDGQGLDDPRQQAAEAAAASVEGEMESIAPSPSRVTESPVLVRGNRVLVPVEIGCFGRKIQTHLLLDTGASLTILHQRAARKLMLTGAEAREAIVVGGSRVPIRMAEVDYIQVGPYKVPHAQLAIIRHQGAGQEYQGLLGMNILRALDYTLDVNRGVIVWNR